MTGGGIGEFRGFQRGPGHLASAGGRALLEGMKAWVRVACEALSRPQPRLVQAVIARNGGTAPIFAGEPSRMQDNRNPTRLRAYPWNDASLW